jgi:hypothetical protein
MNARRIGSAHQLPQPAQFCLLLLAISLCLSACQAEPTTFVTCPLPPNVTFPVDISLITPLPMPLGQFLGRTRAQNEVLLTPQSEQVLTGWVTYAPGFSLRYRGGQAVALKTMLDTSVLWQEIMADAGFQPAAAPDCRDDICRWEMGELCYAAMSLAATWNSVTGELHVWQASRGINGWLLAGGVLWVALLAWALLWRWKARSK